MTPKRTSVVAQLLHLRRTRQQRPLVCAVGEVIASMPETAVRMLGAEKKQLGTHSVRKGAATYCTSVANGPSTVQVFLRAGWSLGGEFGSAQHYSRRAS